MALGIQALPKGIKHIFFFLVPRIECRAVLMLDKCSVTELKAQISHLNIILCEDL